MTSHCLPGSLHGIILFLGSNYWNQRHIVQFLAHLEYHPNEVMESQFVILYHCCDSVLTLAYVSGPLGHVTNDKRNHTWQIYVPISCINTHQMLGQCDLYFRNGRFLKKFSHFCQIRSHVQNKAKFCTLLYLSTVHISLNTFGPWSIFRIWQL